MKRFNKVFPMVILNLFLFASLASFASAHVVVYPKVATQGSYEKFAVRVPTEKEVPTVKVEVIIPADVTISRFEPKPGWKYELTKDDSGKITQVIWSATDEGLAATEFADFNMQGKVGDQAAQIIWKAFQTYSDGSVVEWTGAADSKTPASVTSIKPKAAASESDSHGGTDGTTEPPAASAGDTEESNLPLYLSIAALALGAIALMLSLFRRAK